MPHSNQEYECIPTICWGNLTGGRGRSRNTPSHVSQQEAALSPERYEPAGHYTKGFTFGAVDINKSLHAYQLKVTLTVAFNALIAWSWVNPIETIIATASSFTDSDSLAPPPGTLSGAVKSEERNKRKTSRAKTSGLWNVAGFSELANF